MNAAEVILKILHQMGIAQVFELPGSQIAPFLASRQLKSYRVTDVTHESQALFAACGYAKGSGRPALVLTAGGPGILNTVNGFKHLSLYRLPAVLISGSFSSSGKDPMAFQDVDAFRVLRSSGQALKVRKINELPKIMKIIWRKTFLESVPVYIEIPVKLQKSPVPHQIIEEMQNYKQINDKGRVSTSSISLTGRKFILAVGERLIHSPFYRSRSLRLLKKVKFPIFAPYGIKGIGRYEVKSPSYYKLPGDHPLKEGMWILLDVTYDWRFKAAVNKKGNNVVQVNEPDECIHILDNLLQIQPDENWLKKVIKAEEKSLVDYYGSQFYPTGFFKLLTSYVSSQVNLVSDGGDASVLAEDLFSQGKIMFYLGPGPMWNIGTGLGHALGLSLATKKRTILITGDGSLSMSLGEILTVKKHMTDVKIFVLNDTSWGLISHAHRKEGVKEKNVKTDVRFYGRIASAVGIDGYDVNAWDEKSVTQAVKRSFSYKGPSLINLFAGQKHKSRGKLLIERSLGGLI